MVMVMRRTESSFWFPGTHASESFAMAVWIVALALVPLACDPQTTLTGTITDANGKPIAHAVVRTICEDQSGAMKAVSDGAGRFFAEGLGCIAESCRLEVAVPERPAQSLRVRDYCTNSRFACRGACSSLDVVVKIRPK
jgi:hypothetical protein